MDISFSTVMSEIASNPVLLVTIILSIGTVIINGATDASNAIASAIATKSISPFKAIMMAAILNFAGVALMTLVSTAVAHTIFNMVDLGSDSTAALIALMSAMVAIIVWGAIGWMFGIPTSQSHSLIAGITGAAIALSFSFDCINWSEWVKVIYGLVASMGLGFGLGWLFTKLIGLACRNVNFRHSQKTFGRLQVVAAGLLAFMHGAQDGQKFMSVCVLGVMLAMGSGHVMGEMSFPLWVIVLCSSSMCLGTALGGKRIIKSVGMDMVKMEKWQGFAATMAASASILISTLSGFPISTTHTNTTAIMGVGSAKRLTAVKWGVAKDMVWTWILTFPGCGLIAFGLTFFFRWLLQIV